MPTIRTKQGDTVDAVCYRHFGATAGITESVLEANRGLAALGPILPLGTLITLPESAQATSPRTDMVQLWD